MDAVADAERVGRFQSYAFRQRVKRTLARKRADAARQHDVGEARAVRVELLLVNVAKKLSDRDPMEILGNLPAGRGMVLMMTEANRRVKGPETFAQCPFTLYSEKGAGRFRGVSVAISQYFVGQCKVNLKQIAADARILHYPEMLAVHAALERSHFLFIVIYVAPLGYQPVAQMIDDPEFTAAMNLLSATIVAARAGKIPGLSSDARIAVGTDVNSHCGSGANSVFLNWHSRDVRPPCARARELAARVEALELFPTSNVHGGMVKSTFVRAGSEHRAATESVLDICFVDRKLMALVDSVVVRSDQPGDHFLDTLLTNMDGHLLVTTTAMIPVGGRDEDAPRPVTSRSYLPKRVKVGDLPHWMRRACGRAVNVAFGELYDRIPDVTPEIATASLHQIVRSFYADVQPKYVPLPRASAGTWRIIRLCRRTLRAARGVPSAESAVAAAELRAAYRELKRVKRAEIEEGHGKMRMAVADAAGHNQGKAVWQWIGSAIGQAPHTGGLPSLRNPDGSWAHTDSEKKVLLLGEARKHTTAPGREDPLYDRDVFDHVMSQYNELMGIFREYASLDDGDRAISAIETVQSLRDSKPHKGADPEGTLSEFLADMVNGVPDRDAVHLPGVVMWVDIFNRMFDAGVSSPAWLEQVLTPLYKGHNLPPANIGSYRFISVHNRIEAVLHRILMRRIVNMIDRRGGFTDDQYGFRRDRSTEQCIAQLAMLLEARIMQGVTAAERRTFAAFLDVKAAFPTLWRELTFVELFALGIRGKLFAYLYCCPLFNGMMSLKCGLEPLAEGRWSDTRGAMTGVAGAPVVHNVNAARIAMSVKIYAFGCGIPLQNGAVIHSLHYADDVVLLATTPAGLQLQLDAAGRRSYEDRFLWSPPKSIVVVFGHDGDDNDLRFFFHLRGEQIKVETSFQYLGVRRINKITMGPGHEDARHVAILSALGPRASAAVMLRAAAANGVLTLREVRMLYHSFFRGLVTYNAAEGSRGENAAVDRADVTMVRTLLGISPRESVDNAALYGEMGLKKMLAVAVSAAVRLHTYIVHREPAAQIRSVFEHYAAVCEAHGFPPGNWCSWVREAYGLLGFPQLYATGWDTAVAGMTIKEAVVAWQQTVWRQRVMDSGRLGVYARLARHLEAREYHADGPRRSRIVLYRLRTETFPCEIKVLREQGIVRALRTCRACALAELGGTYHALCRCSLYNGPRARMYAAVAACAPPGMLAWLGPMADPENDGKWAAILLDGELDGVPFAEAYGRHRRAIHEFPDFDVFKHQYLTILEWRKALRETLKAPLLEIVKAASRRFGYTDV